MSDSAKPIRQYTFVNGANYTDSPFALSESELAQAVNVYDDGGLKVIEGAARVVSTAFATSTNTVLQLYEYRKAAGNTYQVAMARKGASAVRLAYRTTGNWTDITTNRALFYASFATFNSTMLFSNGSNNLNKWDGTTFADVSGSPPKFKYLGVQGDYVLGAGHSGSIVRFCDTADHNTWPTGNTINIGLDQGQSHQGIIRWDEDLLFFLQHSIYRLVGFTPLTFSPQPTNSSLGTRSPRSLTWTPRGIMFWSEAGPAIFDGDRTFLLTKRMRSIMDGVAWDNPSAIHAAYDSSRDLWFTFYATASSGYATQGLVIDCRTLNPQDQDCTFWPLTVPATASKPMDVNTSGRRSMHFGHGTGHVTLWPSGTTWNGSTVTGRARSRVWHLGPRQQVGTRDIDVWTKAQAGSLTVKTAVNAGTFAEHTNSTVNTAAATAGDSMRWNRLYGGGTAGQLGVGRCIQVEFTHATTGFVLYGYEINLEPLGERK